MPPTPRPCLCLRIRQQMHRRCHHRHHLCQGRGKQFCSQQGYPTSPRRAQVPKHLGHHTGLQMDPNSATEKGPLQDLVDTPRIGPPSNRHCSNFRSWTNRNSNMQGMEGMEDLMEVRSHQIILLRATRLTGRGSLPQPSACWHRARGVGIRMRRWSPNQRGMDIKQGTQVFPVTLR